MPVLKRTAKEPNSDVRIVVVSSKMHLRVPEKPDFRNLEGWNVRKGEGVVDSGLRYATTKLANVLFTRELQSRLDAEKVPITCISVHPGIVSTEGPKNAVKTGILAFFIKLILASFGLTPLQGAYTTLFAATSSKIKAEPEKYKGSYVQPFNRLAEVSAYAKDKQLAEDLWACSEEKDSPPNMQIFPSINYGYSTYDPDSDIPDLQGKVILVTGANSGIGFEVAEVLASKGAKVYLGARDESRGKAAAQTIRDSISNLSSAGSVHWLPLDLSTPQATKAGADAFLGLESRLDILIHNAGMYAGSQLLFVALGDVTISLIARQVEGYSTVSEGGLTFSKIMSTNHLGSFVLTQELMPVLKRTAKEPKSDVRIVVVSSQAQLRVSERPDFRNLEGWNVPKSDSVFDSLTRYAISKLAKVLFTRELQSRLDAEKVPITCISLHPGLVSTEGPTKNHKTGIYAYLVRLALALFGLTPLQGAYTTLFAATSPKIEAEPAKYKGSYLQPFNRLAEANAYSKDKQLAEDLWACSEEVAEICLKEAAPRT
ncbi:hypothetical protein FRC01_009298 [Tulasnella sp. 417]|nr:hypothetical protein FRC01_009298 [Tulasnella sp. 417]